MTDDFLDEMIDERTLASPAFPAALDAAVRRRQTEAEGDAASASDSK